MGAAQGIILYDTELRYQLFNPFMERLTGSVWMRFWVAWRWRFFRDFEPVGLKTS